MRITALMASRNGLRQQRDVGRHVLAPDVEQQRDAHLIAAVPHFMPIGVVPQQAFAVAEPVGHAVDVHDASGNAVAVARHRQHEMKAQNAAERAVVLGDVLAGRQKGQYGRHHFRRLVQQRGDRRAALQVLLHRHAIGLHDEHAPVAPVIGRNIRLRRHDVVEARHFVEHSGDVQRFAADIDPAVGEAFGVGEIMLGVERRRRRDAAVIDGAHNAGRTVVKLHGLFSADGSRPGHEYSLGAGR